MIRCNFFVVLEKEWGGFYPVPSTLYLISLRSGFRKKFLSVLHPNLVSSPIKGILMDILARTDCVRSSAGNISLIDIFSNSNLQKY